MSSNILTKERRGVNPIVVVDGVITRADVAEDLSKLMEGEQIARLASMKEIKQYLKIQDEHI